MFIIVYELNNVKRVMYWEVFMVYFFVIAPEQEFDRLLIRNI